MTSHRTSKWIMMTMNLIIPVFLMVPGVLAGGLNPVLDEPVPRSFTWWPFDVSAPYSHVPDVSSPSVIRLAVGDFDTTDGDMILPKELYAQDLAEGQTGMFLVQFNGPVKESDKAVLEEIGLKLHKYVSNFAFVVSATPGQIRTASCLPFVNWSGRFHPAYRIHPLFGRRHFRILANLDSDKVSILVQVNDHNSLQDVIERIEQIDGNVDNLFIHSDPPCLTAKIYPESVFELARLESISMIEERGEYFTLNDETQEVLQSGRVADGTPIWDAGIHGEDQILGHMDSGVDPDHCFFIDQSQPLPGPNPNFSHRKIIAYRTYADGEAYDKCENGHGTHTAGTAAGYTANSAGIDYIGLAYESKLTVADVGQDDWLGCYLGYLSVPGDLTGIYSDAYGDGARVHTNSWGSTENTYDAMANQTDTYMWNNKDFLILYANGNSGPDAGTMGTPATSKNIIAVGGSNNEPNQNDIWSSSSRGPVNGSNRLAPALMAPSTDGTGYLGGIDSSASDGSTGSENCGFVGQGYQGTSMACPAAAGCALLVRQYFMDGYYPTGAAVPANGFTPTAALMKATMINGAFDMTNVNHRPNNNQGWGRVHLDQSLYLSGDSDRLDVHDDTVGLGTGETFDYNINVNSGSSNLRITLCWTDRAGNNLVNDLDLELIKGGQTWYGNNFQNGWTANGTSRDRNLPTECIFLNSSSVTPGSYTVRVSGFNVPQGEASGKQPFALVITGDISAGMPPTPTATPDPSWTNTPGPTGTPTYTPTATTTPDPSWTNTPIPSFTPNPTHTPTPACERIGVKIEMPSNHYKPGDPCYLNLRFCNVSQVPIPDTPVFLLLDVFGDYFFAPGWSTTFDHYTLTIAPGQAMIEILPAFNWPSGTGSATGLLFYAALTDPGYTQILGEFDSWDISWSEL